MICLNLKVYKESIGLNGVKILEQVSKYVADNPESKEKFCVAPSMLQLASLSKNFPNVTMAAQHSDSLPLGAGTGMVPAEEIFDLGVRYTVLNHSEHRVYNEKINDNIFYMQSIGLKVIVCCESIQEAEELLTAKPYAIAYETKELIGSGKSVATENPEIVTDFVKLVKGKSKAFIGAGISTGEDIKKGLELGAEGFILASAFVKATDQYAKLDEFIQAFKI